MLKVTTHQFRLDPDGSAIHEPTGTRIEFTDSWGKPVRHVHFPMGQDGHLTRYISKAETGGYFREEIEAVAVRYMQKQRRKEMRRQSDGR